MRHATKDWSCRYHHRRSQKLGQRKLERVINGQLFDDAPEVSVTN